VKHVHDGCLTDTEGPTVIYLCGYEPHSAPRPGVTSAAGLVYDPDRDLYVDETGYEPSWQRHRREIEESGRT
jgi:hypothetical protein